ncbi:MAG: integrase arm-type DNA-binding domain-containing protein [Burkholderiales bacterium]|nr:integrase arm-type DNA-binding domain-containing protein [Burkholderiales bacterium]
MALTDTTIRAAASKEKAYKLFDERGLYLLITPAGGRFWRLKYTFGGREKLISLGDYLDVPLKRAREKRDAARRLVADGKDPSAERQAEKAARADTLEAVAREWLAANKARLAPTTYAKRLQRFEAFVFPYLGSRPIRSITAPELLAVLKRVEGRGLHESAHRVRSECGTIFRYAIATGRAERDLSADLRGALVPYAVKNHAAITEPARIGELLRAICGYHGQPATETALKLAPLVFVRPGELRGARWPEITLDGKEPEWRIPAERMKAREAHVVPLARQAVALLRELHPITGPDGFVFPSLTSPSRPISENTINASLRRLGFAAGEMTGHGFRSMASTRLNEMGFPPDVIELQLAHAERDEVRGAYNRATRIAERRKMMQKWADYLDGLRIGRSSEETRRPAR